MHLRDYIEHLKSKPEDIRRSIALGASLGVTGLVAVGWIVALGASGTLALSAPINTPASADVAAATKETQTSFSNLLGAASAFQSIKDGAAPLTIIDAKSSSTLDAKADATEGKTIIPF